MNENELIRQYETAIKFLMANRGRFPHVAPDGLHLKFDEPGAITVWWAAGGPGGRSVKVVPDIMDRLRIRRAIHDATGANVMVCHRTGQTAIFYFAPRPSMGGPGSPNRIDVWQPYPVRMIQSWIGEANYEEVMFIS